MCHTFIEEHRKILFKLFVLKSRLVSHPFKIESNDKASHLKFERRKHSAAIPSYIH